MLNCLTVASLRKWPAFIKPFGIDQAGTTSGARCSQTQAPEAWTSQRQLVGAQLQQHGLKAVARKAFWAILGISGPG